MHKINRDAVTAPSCLLSSSQYDVLRGSEKEEIRSTLLGLQGHRCAYCERRTGDDRDDGHIEHFRNQADHAHLCCDWDNLFWSCNDEKTCGKHKDKCAKNIGRYKAFNSDEIINPACDDPESFLLFVSDGTVRSVDGLSEPDRRRAEETLRVFHLAGSALLRRSREDAVSPYKSVVDNLATNSPSLLVPFVESELSKLDTKPFSAAIRSFLKSVMPL